MTARDELAGVILQAFADYLGYESSEFSDSVSAVSIDHTNLDLTVIADAILAAGWVKPPGPCPECQGLPGTNVRQHKYWCKTVEGIVQHGEVYD